MSETMQRPDGAMWDPLVCMFCKNEIENGEVYGTLMEPYEVPPWPSGTAQTLVGHAHEDCIP